MTSNFFLNWGTIAVSVFNTILLFWLALTVLLNAQRKRLGVFLAGTGMTMGSIFFAIHTIIIYSGFTYTESQINALWSLGWTILLILPFAWYMLILWYLGFWENNEHYLQKRQKYWFIADSILFLITARYVLFTKTLPTFLDFASLDMSNALSIRNIPILIIIYPIYILLSIILSIDALRFPGPNFRLMGDLARMRARPWLTGVSFLLLTVSLMVTSFMIWVVFNSWKYNQYGTYIGIYTIIGITDLIISSFISVAILLLGQAITSYEIFTGNTLPRRGLFRNWLNTIFLSAAYSIIIGAGLVGRIPVIHYLMFTAFLMTGFYVMANKRFYTERERFMEELYPFVKTQNIYTNLLDNKDNFNNHDNTTFYAMCEDILETEKAVLIPLGYFSSLINKRFEYPDLQKNNEYIENIDFNKQENENTESGNLELSEETIIIETNMELVKEEDKSIDTTSFQNIPQELDQDLDYESIINSVDLHEKLCIMLNPNDFNKLILCVPLWSEKGLSGLLFIGRKKDNGLYSQEEIQIARSISERILDTFASTQMAKTLVETQRKRMTETKLIDNQTRRILHDEILPLLHTSIIDLSSNNSNSEAINNISQAHKEISNLLQNNGNDSLTKVSKSGLIVALKDFVNKEMINCFNQIIWDISNESEEYLKTLSLTINEVIFYAVREIIRNSAKYAKNKENNLILSITSFINLNELKIIVQDNGQGINPDHKSESGSGQGLKLHSTMLAIVGGYISIETERNKFKKKTTSNLTESNINEDIENENLIEDNFNKDFNTYTKVSLVLPIN